MELVVVSGMAAAGLLLLLLLLLAMQEEGCDSVLESGKPTGHLLLHVGGGLAQLPLDPGCQASSLRWIGRACR
jgi:hypothetical protein